MSVIYTPRTPNASTSECLIECSTGTEDAAPVGQVGFRLFRTLLSMTIVAEAVSGNLAAGQLRAWLQIPWAAHGAGAWIRYPEQDLQIVPGANQVWSRLFPAYGRLVYLPHSVGVPVRIYIGALIHG
jgi:hypothetical protein